MGEATALGVGAILGELTARIGLDTSPLKSGVDKAKGILGGTGGLKEHLAAVGTTATAVAVAVTAFGVKSADKFSEVGGEVLKLTRLTGESAETMSRFRFAAEESGVSTDALGRAFKAFSTQAEKAKSPVTDFGVAVKDAHGNTRDMTTMLEEVSAKFKAMPDGVAKNAEAVKLFGRAGLDMIPMLDRGKVGLEELMKESDKYGLTLSGSNLDAIKKSTMAHREFHAAMEGLQVQIGQYVLPVITRLVSALTSWLVPAIHEAGRLAQEYLAPAFNAAFDIIGKAFDGAKQLWDDFMGGFQNPDASIGPGVNKITALFLSIGAAVHRAFDDIGQVIGIVKGYVGDFLDAFMGGWQNAGAVVETKGPIGFFLKFGELARKLADWMKQVGAPAVAAFTKSFVDLAQHFSAKLLPILGQVALAFASTLGRAIGEAYRWLHDVFVPVLVQTVIPAIVNFATVVAEQVGHVVAFFQEISPQVREALGHLLSVVEVVLSPLIALVAGIIEAIRYAWNHWLDNLRDIAIASWNEIKGVIQAAISLIRDTIKLVLDLINGDWGAAWHELKNIVGDIWNGIFAVVRGSFGILEGILGGGWDVIKSTASAAWNGIETAVSETWGRIEKTIKDAIDKIVGWVTEFKDKVTGLANTAISAVAGDSNFTTGFADRVKAAQQGGHKASGGPLVPGYHYTFNEAGPEDIEMLPGGGGIVRSAANSKGSAGGQSVVINMYGVADGQSVQAAIPALTQAIKAVSAA